MSERVCSILVPSRGPLEVLRGMLESLRDCTAEPERVELILRLDTDDPDLGERCDIIQDSVWMVPTSVLVSEPATMGAMTVEMVKKSTGRSIWLMNDDIVHETYGWDRLVREVTAQRPGHAFFPDDGLFSPELACFPLLPRAHVEATDCFGVGRYERYLIDSIISDLYSFTLDRLVFLPQWKIRHLNAQPTSTLDPMRWFRAVRGDPTRGYQPPHNDMLERDKARYVEHLKDVKYMADVIVNMEMAAV
jgi:hypothetical protein